ncbi:MAG: type II toxin-antitoxin system RelE/ParE family toxin [bacterium]
MKILWTEAAAEDLESIAAYIAADKPGAAVRQVLLVLNAVEDLVAQHPSIGRSGRVPGTREFFITGTPYIIAYRVQQKALQILRVLHGARKWPEKF